MTLRWVLLSCSQCHKLITKRLSYRRVANAAFSCWLPSRALQPPLSSISLTGPQHLATTSGKMSVSGYADSEPLQVKHEADNYQFVITLGKEKAVLQYTRYEDGAVDLWHTLVPRAFRGRGVAKRLAQAALDHFADNSTHMMLSCTYLQKYAKDYPQPKHQQFIILSHI